MLTLIGLLVGAVGFRLRGDAVFERITGRGATTARIVCWAIPCAGLYALAGGHAWWAVGIAAWLGSIPGWWGSLSLGRDPRYGSVWSQIVRHFARGMVWVFPMVVVVEVDGGFGLPLLLAGTLCVPCYEIGWWSRPAHATEIGEALFGAVIGAALAWSVV